jgi:ABC-2 type transport system ATP-binding protein
MADRIGVIDGGQLILVEEKATLMKKLGRKELTIQLAEPLDAVPPELAEWKVELIGKGRELRYVFDRHADRTGVPSLLAKLRDLGINFSDLATHQSSLEEIFVGLVHDRRAA